MLRLAHDSELQTKQIDTALDRHSDRLRLSYAVKAPSDPGCYAELHEPIGAMYEVRTHERNQGNIVRASCELRTK